MHLCCAHSEFQDRARELCQRFGFVLVSEPDATDDYYLLLDDSGLSLCPADNPKASVQVDFCGGTNAHRRQFGGGKGQDIAKAVGISQYSPTVIDATAGLGRDSFVLASLGCQVLACERHPVVAALLEDGLRRAMDDPEVSEIAGRIRLHHGSSHQLLDSGMTGFNPDVIYLDPMFEHDPKQKAAVKKDMQAFRHVVGQDEDTADLLTLALDQARCRVVVKRARKAEPLGGRAPSYSLTGKANRFDVYALAKVAPP